MRIYQTILESESTKNLLAHRNMLCAKVLCIDLEWRKEYYRELIGSVDNALQQIFDNFYQNEPEPDRIDDLLAFWNQIESL